MTVRRRRRGSMALSIVVGAGLVAAIAAPVGAVGPSPAGAPLPRQTIAGVVRSGANGIRDAKVTLYATGGPGAPVEVGHGTTAADGRFSFKADQVRGTSVRYLVAEGGTTRASGPRNDAITLATVLRKRRAPATIVVNERTTVATAYALNQFLDGTTIDGTWPGLPNAAATFRNLVNPATGGIGRVLGRSPNGDRTSTMRAVNSLANLLAGCVRAPRWCDPLFDLARPQGGARPTDTLAAAHAIAANPANHAAALFTLSRRASTYTPALRSSQAPDAWTLALRYDGGGGLFDGPGEFAIDRSGNAYIVNNYVFSLDPKDQAGKVCGSQLLIKLTPDGRLAPDSPFDGGGLYGAGFGVGFDLDGHVWAANFGFQGSNCPVTKSQQSALSRSMSEFTADGTAISPSSTQTKAGGWHGTQDAIFRPQGMATDRKGNLWVASCGGGAVVQFAGANPRADEVIGPAGLVKPFDVTIDPDGVAWATGNGSSSVVAFDGDGDVVHSLSGDAAAAVGVDKPMGIASDSKGNIWISNSGILRVPCTGGTGRSFLDSLQPALADDFQNDDASMTLIRADGTAVGPFTGGGTILPWGVAIDGADTVWVAQFSGQRLVHLCGAVPRNCPAGSRQAGAAISPDTGYGFDGFVRSTGVAIDPSGNVWVTNNWRMKPNPANPGGHQVIVFVGMATPVRTPLIGSPRH